MSQLAHKNKCCKEGRAHRSRSRRSASPSSASTSPCSASTSRSSGGIVPIIDVDAEPEPIKWSEHPPADWVPPPDILALADVVTNQTPDPVTNQTPDPVTNQTPDPATNQTPDPVTNQMPDPVVANQMPDPFENNLKNVAEVSDALHTAVGVYDGANHRASVKKVRA